MFKKITLLTLVAATSALAVGCGTLFRANRIGQKSSDKVDTTILILDCCGLFFGIIPGVVALALDFSNKTIYYSAKEVSVNGKPDTSRMIALHVDDMSQAGIERALSRELGRPIRYSDIQFAN